MPNISAIITTLNETSSNPNSPKSLSNLLGGIGIGLLILCTFGVVTYVCTKLRGPAVRELEGLPPLKIKAQDIQNLQCNESSQAASEDSAIFPGTFSPSVIFSDYTLSDRRSTFEEVDLENTPEISQYSATF